KTRVGSAVWTVVSAHHPRSVMSRGRKLIVLGLPCAALGLFCLYEGCVVQVGVGGIKVTATVHSQSDRQIRKITYGEFGRREEAEFYLPLPPEHAEVYHEAAVKDGHTFSFYVKTTDRVSPFGLLRNQYRWSPFVLFRIECDIGDPILVVADIP